MGHAACSGVMIVPLEILNIVTVVFSIIVHVTTKFYRIRSIQRNLDNFQISVLFKFEINGLIADADQTPPFTLIDQILI